MFLLLCFEIRVCVELRQNMTFNAVTVVKNKCSIWHVKRFLGIQVIGWNYWNTRRDIAWRPNYMFIGRWVNVLLCSVKLDLSLWIDLVSVSLFCSLFCTSTNTHVVKTSSLANVYDLKKWQAKFQNARKLFVWENVLLWQTWINMKMQTKEYVGVENSFFQAKVNWNTIEGTSKRNTRTIFTSIQERLSKGLWQKHR